MHQVVFVNFRLSYGKARLILRPTLRCASTAAQHSGLASLIAKLEQCDLTSIHALIRSAATSADDAERFLAAIHNQPMHRIRQAILPSLFDLITALLPADPDAPKRTTDQKPQSWAKVFNDLYGYGTGWLGWTPAQTWDATPAEIITAMKAHSEKLIAMNGGEANQTAQNNDEAQRQANIDAGLDPEFDRAGLHALKRMAK